MLVITKHADLGWCGFTYIQRDKKFYLLAVRQILFQQIGSSLDRETNQFFEQTERPFIRFSNFGSENMDPKVLDCKCHHHQDRFFPKSFTTAMLTKAKM